MKYKSIQKPLVCGLIIWLLLPLWLLHIGASGTVMGRENGRNTRSNQTQANKTDKTDTPDNTDNQAQYSYLQAANLGVQWLPDLACKIIPDFLVTAHYLSFAAQNNFITKPCITNIFVHSYRRILFLTLIVAKAP